MDGKFELSFENTILKVTLQGQLSAGNAPELSEMLNQYKGQEVNKIVFLANELNYIASAGIRVIIFAIQKILKSTGDAYFIGGQEDVLSVLTMTGIDDSLIIQESF